MEGEFVIQIDINSGKKMEEKLQNEFSQTRGKGNCKQNPQWLSSQTWKNITFLNQKIGA